MHGSSTARPKRNENRIRKNKKDGIFLKQRRQHLRRWRFARNARRAKRRRHREARYRRNHPFPYNWNKSTTKRGQHSKNDIPTTSNNDNNNDIGCKTPTAAASTLIVGTGLLVMALEAVEIGIGIVHGILSLITCAMSLVIAVVTLLTMMPWKMIKCLTYYVLVLVMALEAFGIGLGIVDGIFSLVIAVVTLLATLPWKMMKSLPRAMSGVAVGLGVFAKLPIAKLLWMVLKCILHKVDDYILTPPAFEHPRTKLDFHLYMLCLPFSPCWATTGQESPCSLPDSAPVPVTNPHTTQFKCCKCSTRSSWQETLWDIYDNSLKKLWCAILGSSSDDGDNHSVRVECPNCKEHLVQCRHCKFNFSADKKQRTQRRTVEGNRKTVMRRHLKKSHKDLIATMENTNNVPEPEMENNSGDFFGNANADGINFDGDGFPPHDEDAAEWQDIQDMDTEDLVAMDSSAEEMIQFYSDVIESIHADEEEQSAKDYWEQFKGRDLDPNTGEMGRCQKPS